MVKNKALVSLFQLIGAAPFSMARLPVTRQHKVTYLFLYQKEFRQKVSHVFFYLLSKRACESR